MRGPVFQALRRELMEMMGTEQCRSLYSRLGYKEGTHDRQLATQVRHDGDQFAAFAVGPQINALTGFGWTTTEHLAFDTTSGTFDSSFLVHDSLEADSHLSEYGVGPEPVCWMLTGYASGFSSAFMGRPILFRETACRANGATACRLVGKPLDVWDREDRETRYFRPEAFINRFNEFAWAEQADESEQNDLVGISSGFSSAMGLIRRAAPTRVSILFMGETGVGKEIFARAAHRLSPRNDAPFIAVNCSALPEPLVEAELFGVERGAYTGATEARPGRFERADGGTLFLDEIANLNWASQGKLLRALQEGEIERIGGVDTFHVDVRVIAATNVDLEQAVANGRFRQDLYFRLATFPVHIPPLRERRDDIPLLIEHFLKQYGARHGRRIRGLTEAAVNALLRYDYPGNIRQLENMVERAVILADDDTAIGVEHLFTPGDRPPAAGLAVSGAGHLEPGAESSAETGASTFALPPGTTLAELELRLMREAVEQHRGNLSAAARALGITRRQLAYRLDKMG